MSWFGDLLTHDGVQTVASVAALFTGGFVGARVAGVVRVHMDARSWLWNELHKLDGHLRHLELTIQSEARLLNQSLSRSVSQLRSARLEDRAAVLAALEELDLDALEHTAIEWRRSFNEATLRAELLTWSEREAFDQYRDLLPSCRVAAVKAIPQDFAVTMLLFFVHVDEVANERSDEEDFQEILKQFVQIAGRLQRAQAIVPKPSELERWATDRQKTTSKLRLDIYRRLRPRWWQRPADWRHSIGLACAKVLRRRRTK